MEAQRFSGRFGCTGEPSTTSTGVRGVREQADVVLVGLGTVVSEHYHSPGSGDLQIFGHRGQARRLGCPGTLASGSATLVLPEDAGAVHEGVPTLRAGSDGRVDWPRSSRYLAGKVALLEGGPTLAGVMMSLGLVDEFFLTVAPRVVAGESTRVVHGPDADPAPWELLHGFVDEQGFLFLRYGRR